MSSQQERADQELVDNGDELVVDELAVEEVAGEEWAIGGIDQHLTPLQYHYLSLLQRLIAVKNSYQTDPDFEGWLRAGINKAIYSTLRDCIESNIGDAAKELLRNEHQVN